MDTQKIAGLLTPFASGLSPAQLQAISMYIDVLVRWNRKINLTAVRDPEQMVTRHFGESLFAAQRLFADGSGAQRVVDVGSGAGFPGLPTKIWAPEISLTLIESNQKKAVFLRELVRALALADVNVFDRRAEDYPVASAAVVTMRAVERFEFILPTAARLINPGGRLALLIGVNQVSQAKASAADFQWDPPIPIPQSDSRVLQVGKHS